MKHILLYLLPLLCFSCSPDKNVFNIVLNSNTATGFDQFYVCNVDSLADDTPNFWTIPVDEINKYGTLFTNEIDFFNFREIFPKEPHTDESKYILGASITYDGSDDLYLLMGGEGDVTVYQDGELIAEATEYKVYEKYNKYVELKSINKVSELRLVVSFPRLVKNKRMVLGFASKKVAQKYHHNAYSSHFIANSIMSQNDDIKLIADFQLYGKELPCKVLDSNGDSRDGYLVNNTIVLKKQISDDGVYTCKIVTPGGQTYIQSLVVGNEDSLFYKSVSSLYKQLPKDVFEAKVRAYVSRYQHLSKYPKDTIQRIARFKVLVSQNGNIWTDSDVISSQSVTLESGTVNIKKNSSRYLRIVGLGNSFHSWNKICEVRLWGKKDSASLLSEELVIQNVVASSYESDNFPANVIDNDLNTSWQSASEGEWLLLDLQRECFIDSIQIAWGENVGTDMLLSSYLKDKAECLQYVASLEAGSNSDLSVLPPKMLRSYSSPIDGSRQEYLVQLPGQYQKSVPKPLVLHIPPKFQTPQVLSKSYLYKSAEVVNMYNLLGDHDVIDVWSFGANYSGRLLPSGVKEYDEVIGNVVKEFNVDTNRIYLMATCSGTLKAIQYASETAIPIAAMAFCPAYYETEGLLNSQKLMENVKDIPMYAVNSTKDAVTPIKGLNMLVDSISAFDNQFQSDTIQSLGRDFLVPEKQKDLLGFLLKHTLVERHKTKSPQSAQLKHCYENMPLNRFFAEKFVCVVNGKTKSETEFLKHSLATDYGNAFKRPIIFIEMNEIEKHNKVNILYVNTQNNKTIPHSLLNHDLFDLGKQTLTVKGEQEQILVGKGFVAHYPAEAERNVLLVDLSLFGGRYEDVWESIYYHQYNYFLFNFRTDDVTIVEEGFWNVN